jgi:lipoprotein-releasing system permease protein
MAAGMSSTIAPSNASIAHTGGGRVFTVWSRLAGLLLDAMLLVLFLVAATALLDVLVRVIVLSVGYATAWRIDPRDYQFYGFDPKRHLDDWGRFGLSLVAAVVLGAVFYGGLRLRRYLMSRFIDASFESFVSRRYLLASGGRSLVSLITIVSVLGVAVGVMALVVVISVMNGFNRTLTEKMMGIFAHVEVWPNPLGTERQFTEDQATRIVETAKTLPGFKTASPVYMFETVLIEDPRDFSNKKGVMMQGLSFGEGEAVSRIPESVVAGNKIPGFREIVLGYDVARQMGLSIGDKVFAFGPSVTTAQGPQFRRSQYTVVGIFRSGLPEVDSLFSYTTLESVQDIALTPGKVGTVHILVDEPDNALLFGRDLREALGNRVLTRPWQELNPGFFQALQTEKIAMFIILLLIVLVASLNIVGTLIMVVTQKTREIGILKSMGATGQMVLRVFFLHGLFIGLVGTSLGLAWGLWLCRFVHYEIEKIFNLPAEVYGLDRLPVDVDPQTLVLIAVCSMVICTLAGLLPAWWASRLDPVESLRYD